MIEIDNINFSYPRAQQPVFTAFSLCVEKGGVTALSGPNGCGKTTLARLIVGLLRPSAGRIVIDGTDIAPLNLFEIGQRAGYLFQNPNRQLFNTSVYEEIAVGLRNRGLAADVVERRVAELLEDFYLTAYRDVFPLQLSLGERQRVALAAVLALDSDYLLLDEPTCGLDMRCRRQLGELLLDLCARRQRGLLVISHERSFIRRYCDRELVLG
ncbi:MAG: ABC transporter ATP-binding protein [Bacillota bacterium]|nr:ABC transporter ATP-binding protein [Bacillota bacterium]